MFSRPQQCRNPLGWDKIMLKEILFDILDSGLIFS